MPPIASSIICMEDVSTHSFIQDLFGIYFLPSALPGIWVKSENKIDSPPKCLILVTRDEQSIINIVKYV